MSPAVCRLLRASDAALSDAQRMARDAEGTDVALEWSETLLSLDPWTGRYGHAAVVGGSRAGAVLAQPGTSVAADVRHDPNGQGVLPRDHWACWTGWVAAQQRKMTRPGARLATRDFFSLAGKSRSRRPSFGLPDRQGPCASKGGAFRGGARLEPGAVP